MDMGDLRPIALCNVLYKIISKFISNRLKAVMPSIISDTQSAFLQGRLISDNIMISYEIMHYLKRKRRGWDGVMALKLDISKADGRLEWGYLRAMLERMGFDGRWINLIMHCVGTVSYTISHGGKELGPIVAQMGLRQGDHLSPYLFILYVEGFSSLLRSYEHSGLITRCKVVRSASAISHMDIICELLEIYEADENGSYLGLPYSVGKNKNVILGFLKDKIKKKIQGWEGRILSRAGKEVLLKSVAQSIPSYAMSVFLLPLDTCRELERLMAKIWWQTDYVFVERVLVG
ncbi:hypothetical protein CsatB_022923 [Cannabis sativa]